MGPWTRSHKPPRPVDLKCVWSPGGEAVGKNGDVPPPGKRHACSTCVLTCPVTCVLSTWGTCRSHGHTRLQSVLWRRVQAAGSGCPCRAPAPEELRALTTLSWAASSPHTGTPRPHRGSGACRGPITRFTELLICRPLAPGDGRTCHPPRCP